MEKNCKKYKKPFEINPNYPKNEMRKECYFKLREREFKCKSCRVPIDGHNYYWHQKLCNKCYEEQKEVYFKSINKNG